MRRSDEARKVFHRAIVHRFERARRRATCPAHRPRGICDLLKALFQGPRAGDKAEREELDRLSNKLQSGLAPTVCLLRFYRSDTISLTTATRSVLAL